MHAGYHWEFMGEIWKCLVCSHHSVRDISPTGLRGIDNNFLYKNSHHKDYEKEISRIVKDLFYEKLSSGASIKILIPIMKSDSIIINIERQFSPRKRPIRRDKKRTDQKKIDRMYYSLCDISSKTSVEMKRPMDKLEKVRYEFLDVLPRFQSLVRRSENIGNGIRKAAKLSLIHI